MGRRFIAYLAAHRLVAFLCIFSLSFFVRFPLLARLPRSEIVGGGEAVRIANALVSKGQFADPYAIPTGPTAHTTPFFPVLTAGVYEVFGNGYRGNFVRCLLVVSSYSLLYALYPSFASAFGFPYAAGLIAGLVSALVPVKRSAEVFRGWEEPYAAMALAFLLLLTLKQWKSSNSDAKGAFFLGLWWGAALYISFPLFGVLAGLLLFGLVANRKPGNLRDACLTMVAVVAVTAPWILRNRAELGGWILMRDNLGLELNYSNHDHAAPSSTLLNADPASWGLHPSNSVTVATEVKSVGELEFNRRQLNMAVKWIRTHPASFARLSLERAFYFWFGPIEHPFELLATSFYSVLGLAGLGLIWKRVGNTQFWLWCIVFATYPLVYYFVQYINRYRVPIDWMVWLSAAMAVTAVLQKLSPSSSPAGRAQPLSKESRSHPGAP
jgi:hypothetical protein